MLISISFYSKTFEDSDKQIAYNKATKWIQKNVITKDENKETTFKMEENPDTVLPSYKVTLFCSLPTAEEENRFCDACKVYHKSFFINQEYNCSACRHKAFLHRMDERLRVKRSFRKEKLNYYDKK